MAFLVQCPGCRTSFRLTGEYIDRPVRCCRCRRVFQTVDPTAAPAKSPAHYSYEHDLDTLFREDVFAGAPQTPPAAPRPAQPSSPPQLVPSAVGAGRTPGQPNDAGIVEIDPREIVRRKEQREAEQVAKAKREGQFTINRKLNEEIEESIARQARQPAPIINRIAAALLDAAITTPIALLIYFISMFLIAFAMQTSGTDMTSGDKWGPVQDVRGNRSTDANDVNYTLVLLRYVVMIVGNTLSYVAVNGFFLSRSGQTVGKMVLGLQIVDFSNMKPAPLDSLILNRFLFIQFIGMTCCIVPFLIGVYNLYAFFLTDERRLFHDQVANTIVVDYYEDRKTKRG